ncbi:uncharacterized protein LOC120466950 [Pimephales promelas]|uniref:uncharacterized protein LOC120466950 n=1 Tax=Pimephales promelas TaxID=90988 RepID=UPI0019558223|nr:uncharacterized protein LOC120466950 [Pimephales promelas]
MQFSALLFISSISAAVGMVRVLVTKPVISYCHQAITLHCNVSLSDGKGREFQVTHLSWIKESNKTICSESNTAISGFFSCQYMANKQLVLTIAYPKPDDIGRYVCKLRSSHGHTNADTNVTLECPQIIVQIHEDGNSVTCKVERSNHDGCIHWFHGTVNLTSQSTQDIYSAVDGSYTVISSLNVSSNWKTYNCSYWVPQIEQYIASKNIVMKHTKSNTQSFNSGRRPDLVFCLCLLWMLIQQ